MAIEVLKRALSVKQPIPELILMGKKKQEYRKRRTHIFERVYLYAGKQYHREFPDYPAEDAARLPRGFIVGSVAIVGCHEDEEEENCFVWELADPIRYAKPLIPHGVPQPGFWWPTF